MDAGPDLAVRGRAMRAAGWWTDRLIDDDRARCASGKSRMKSTQIVRYRMIFGDTGVTVRAPGPRATGWQETQRHE